MKYYVAYQLLFWISSSAIAQKYDNNWIMGWPNTGMNFDTPSVYYYPKSKSFYYFLSSCSMSDKDGKLQFFSNGIEIHDRNGDLMEGGNRLALSLDDTISGFGTDFNQSPLCLPMPGSDSLYYFFHLSYGDTGILTAHHLYYSIIDASANESLGKVISLNNKLLDSAMVISGMSACKHANGKDWWLVKPQYNSNGYFKFLVKANGIIDGPFLQNIGLKHPPPDWKGQVVFSPNGDRMAFTNGLQKGILLDFDRCTGLLSNPKYFWGLDNEYAVGGIGLSFSNNGRFLYITSDSFKVYQLDIYADSLNGSKILLTKTKEVTQLRQPSYHQLTPDGKIYISGDGSPIPLTIIHQPDSFGLTCGIDTFALNVVPPGFTLGMPTFPHYRTAATRSYQADAGDNMTICSGDTVQLGLSAIDSVIYQWQSDISFLTAINIAQPLVLPTHTTTYYLTITDTVPRGYSCNQRTDSITVCVLSNPCALAVNDLKHEQIQLYPNPARELINLSYELRANGLLRFEMLNQWGEQVLSEMVDKRQTFAQYSITNLSSGVYYWRLKERYRTIQTGKLVIMK